MLQVLKDNLKDTGLPSFKTAISQRQSYIKSILDGKSIFETNDGNAKGEIEILTREILTIFES